MWPRTRRTQSSTHHAGVCVCVCVCVCVQRHPPSQSPSRAPLPPPLVLLWYRSAHMPPALPPSLCNRTTKFPREVPPLPWYRAAVPQMLMAGFLPFSAIYIELYYIFASIWGHKVGLPIGSAVQEAGGGVLLLPLVRTPPMKQPPLGRTPHMAETTQAPPLLPASDLHHLLHPLHRRCPAPSPLHLLPPFPLASDLHHLLHPVHRVHHPGHRHGLHHRCTHLLPARRRRPQVHRIGGGYSDGSIDLNL